MRDGWKVDERWVEGRWEMGGRSMEDGWKVDGRWVEGRWEMGGR